MTDSVFMEPFERQIIDSIESLLLDDDSANDGVHYDDRKINTSNNNNNNHRNVESTMMPFARVPEMPIPAKAKSKPKFQLNLNQAYFKGNSNACGYVGFASAAAPKSPLLDATSYGGTQDYTRWSTIESDELTGADQVPYMATSGSSPQPLPQTPTTPISPHSEFSFESSGSMLSSISPISSASSLSPVDNNTQFLFNQYLLNNHQQQQLAEEMKMRNLAHLLNMNMSLSPYINSALNNVAYNQMVQQRLFNQEQEYRRFMNYYKNVKKPNMYGVPPKPFCTFCKNNGESQWVSHWHL